MVFAPDGGKSVKVVWTRADDSRFDSPRSPSVQTVKVAFGEGGRVTVMDHAGCAGWPTQAMAPFFMPKGANGVAFDPFAINGANHGYNVGTLAQMEGAALWGLSLALFEGTAFENGEVCDTNLDSYTPLRMGDVPDMAIEFMPSTEVPVGLGEPATTVVGPAIGNAIFRAVGARVRDLPIRAEAVKA